jgi:3-hydroxyisobutyrate dehydrogenase-like beta-hydroxyacid dehydrogenase
MTAEIHILTAAHDHQTQLLAEAAARRQIRRSDAPTSGSQPATRQRLNTLLRRLAAATSFA